jgi:predicted ATPase
MYEAELYRLKGTLTLQSEVFDPRPLTPKAKPKHVFTRPSRLRASSRRSRWNCAVMSLSRLRQQQGKKEEARQMLAEIYGWFTEGFDTTDLQDAKALLKALA